MTASACSRWLAALLLGPATALSATFCVHDAAAIQAALTAAQSNGEDDTIHIVAGTYTLATGLTYASTEAHFLTITGLYQDNACTVTSDTSAGATLDGNHLVRPLFISIPNSAFVLIRLNFVAGKPPSGSSGGGLLVAASIAGGIDFSSFVGNRTTGANADGGAAYIVSSNQITFSDNLAYGNRGTEVGGFVFQQTAGTAYILNNTIAANITDTLADPGGLLLTGAGSFDLKNNIVWNNADVGGSDFGSQSTHSRKNNDIGVVTPGSTAGAVSHELSVDPDFAPCSGFLCINFALSPTSPLVNAGDSNVAVYDPYDFGGNQRYVAALDIGAYETDVLLRARFEVP